MTTSTPTTRMLALYGNTAGSIRHENCDGGVDVDSHPRIRFGLVVA